MAVLTVSPVMAAPRDTTPSPTPTATGSSQAADARATFGIGPARIGSKDPYFSYDSGPGGVIAELGDGFDGSDAEPLEIALAG